MTLKKALCFYYFVFSFCVLNAQNAPTYIDTLLMELDTMTEDTIVINQLNIIAGEVWSSDLAKAADYAERALEMSEKNEFRSGEMVALYKLSVINRRLGNLTEAIEMSSHSLKIAQQLSDDNYIGRNFNSLGNIYEKRGEYDIAINAFLQAMEAYGRMDYMFGAGIVNNNIGIVFKTQEKYSQAEAYFTKAIDFYSKVKSENIGRATAARAQTFMNLGNVVTNDSLALIYMNKSLKIHTGLNAKYGISSANIGIGSLYLGNEKFEEALPYYLTALRYAEEVGSNSRKTISKTSLAKIYLYLGQQQKALKLSKEALDLTINSGELKLEMRIRDFLTKLYASTGDFQASNEQWTIYDTLKDSIYNIEKVKISNDLEAKYQSTKTEADLAAAQLDVAIEKNKKNGILFISIGLFLLGLFVTQWIMNKQRKRQQQIQMELTFKEKEANQLKELDQFKSSFFTNISHELRTPLTLILSPLADILENRKSKIFHKELHLVQSNARNLHNLVNEIMDLSKMEEGKLELQESRVAIFETINRLFSSFDSMAVLRRINFTLDNQLPDIDVQLDREKFEKIINNLLSNALKFTREKGAVTLKAYKQEGVCFFEIQDTGKGIHPSDLPNVFDRFYQAKYNTGIEQGGSGVGLALSKEFAQLLSGTLSVKSEYDKGSTFVFTIPMKELEQSDILVSEDTAFDEKIQVNDPYVPFMINGHKPKLLIVEDNREMGQYLLQILLDHYQCVLATDGLEAIRQLERQSFDCITSDVMMPNMNGFEFRDRINQNNQWRQIPFVLLTARYLEEDKLRGFKLGIDDYVTKPFSTKELKARIQNLVQNKIERDAFNAEEFKLPQNQQLNVDEEWIKQVEKAVLDNLDNTQFNVDLLGKTVGYSGKQLGRLIKKYTGLTTVNFILEIRLQKARELLERRQCPNVTAAYLEVGISSMSYFTRKFTERFGKNPKDILAGL